MKKINKTRNITNTKHKNVNDNKDMTCTTQKFATKRMNKTSTQLFSIKSSYSLDFIFRMRLTSTHLLRLEDVTVRSFSRSVHDETGGEK